MWYILNGEVFKFAFYVLRICLYLFALTHTWKYLTRSESTYICNILHNLQHMSLKMIHLWWNTQMMSNKFHCSYHQHKLCLEIEPQKKYSLILKKRKIIFRIIYYLIQTSCTIFWGEIYWKTHIFCLVLMNFYRLCLSLIHN